MLKKIIFILILALISFSIYAVFINVLSNYQYEQDLNSLQSKYSLANDFSIINLNNIAIPTALRSYLQFAIPNSTKLSTYIKINYSGKYRESKYGKMHDFKAKSNYNLQTGEMVSEWRIEKNQIIFNKLSEVFLNDKAIYEYKLLGVKEEKIIKGDKASLFLQSRMILDAVYFPYYYIGSNKIELDTVSRNKVAAKFNSGLETIEFILEFNSNNSLASVSSSKFVFGEDRVALKASYENYSNFHGFMIPNSIVVEIENNFDRYILFEAELDSISY